ncbi:MAG: hypothetical protein WEA11_07480 [Acidimicrobiales bacterium]
MFEKFKAKRAAAKVEREAKAEAVQAAKRAAERESLRGAIEEELGFAQARLDAVKNFHGVTGADKPDDINVVVKAGESIYCHVTDAVLVEPRKGPGQWNGRSQGVSMPIPGTRLRYRVGASKGTFQQGEETPSAIDTGTFTVTSNRAIFAGQKQSREWTWSKLLSVTNYDPGWTAIAVSNRQKISGVGVDSANRELFEFWIDLAVARATGDIESLEADCQSDVDQLTEQLNALGPAPATQGLPPAG